MDTNRAVEIFKEDLKSQSVQNKSLVSKYERIKQSVDNFPEEELGCKMLATLTCLESRRSLLQLIFLKYVIKRIGKKESLEVIRREDKLKLFENLSSSTNIDFLNVYMQIIVYLELSLPLSIDILFHLQSVDKAIFFRYLELSTSIYILFEYCNTETFLQMVIEKAIDLPMINNELNFLAKLSYYSEYKYHKIDLKRFKQKYADKQVYLRLFQQLSPEEAIEEEKLFKAECDEMLEMKKKEQKNEKLTRLVENLVKDFKEAKGPTGFSDSIQKYEKEFSALDIKISKDLFTNEKKTECLDQYVSLRDDKHLKKEFTSKSREEVAKLFQTKKLVKIDSKATTNLSVEKDQQVSSKPLVEEKDQNVSVNSSTPKIFSSSVNSVQIKKRGPLKSLKKQKPKSKLTSSKKYIGVPWNKIENPIGTIFTGVDSQELEKLFELSDFNNYVKETSQSNQSLKNSVAACSLSFSNSIQSSAAMLDPKKSMTLNIALARAKEKPAELLKKILDREETNETLCMQLFLYAPTQAELEMIKSSSETEKCGNAEKMLRLVDDLTEYKAALSTCRFKVLFREMPFFDLIKTHYMLYKKLLDSALLPKLFGILLIIGNVLNSNTVNGNAKAFDTRCLSTFKTPSIKKIISGKFNFKELHMEIGVLIQPEKSTEGIILAFQDVQATYDKKDVEDLEFDKTAALFNQLKETYEKAKKYFNVTDLHLFLGEFDVFLKYFED